MVNQKIAATLLAAAYTALAAPSSGCGSGSLQSGVHTVNGREYTLTLPDNYDPNNPYRLVVGIHWWGGSMQDVETGQTVETGVWSYYGLERLSEGSTLFAAPQGNGGAWADPANDYPYILAMIQQIEEGACVETDLRFSIGFSWGGSTSNGLACRSDNPFRAIAAINPAGPFACKTSLAST
jgi:poly(3-hydroxybutyrate) depolymerase